MAESYYYHNSYCYNNSGEYDQYDYHQSESTDHYSFFDHSNDQTYTYDDSSAYNSQISTSEPKCVYYDPNVFYHPAQTQFLISYSVSSELNVPEFEEYDPTPYGGGYDPVQTYGKPLPPSDEICYPKSLSDPAPAHLNDFTFGSLKSPSDQVQDRNAGSNNTSKAADDDKVVESSAKPQAEDHRKEEDNVPEVGSDSSDSEGGGYEVERRVLNQVPSGYGLEAFDMCESLFGYWPCLDRMKRSDEKSAGLQGAGYGDGWGNDGQWSGTADYLFGMSNPYGEHWDREGNYQSALYAYACQKQHQERPLFAHMEY